LVRDQERLRAVAPLSAFEDESKLSDARYTFPLWVNALDIASYREVLLYAYMVGGWIGDGVHAGCVWIALCVGCVWSRVE
jgi:hypothetical protein